MRRGFNMDYLVKFHSGRELEVTDCSVSLGDHGIDFVGKKEIFFIPYSSIEFVVKRVK